MYVHVKYQQPTVYHESFEAEKFRGKLHMQTLAKKLPHTFS